MKHPIEHTLKLCFLLLAACLLSPVSAFATSDGGCGGCDGGSSDGGNDGSKGSSYSSRGPSIPYTPGIEGMPVIDPKYGDFYGAPPRQKPHQDKATTKAKEDWKEKALATLGKYIKGKVGDYLQKKLAFPPILPPPLQVAKEAYDDVSTAVEITKDVLDTVEAARKQFRNPYTKAAQGAYGSNMTNTTEDGTAGDSFGSMNPNSPNWENVGGGGPQAPHDSNFMM